MFDVVFQLFLLGYFAVPGSSGTAPDGRPLPGHEVPADLQQGVFDELACAREPEPTAVLRRLLENGFIDAGTRVDFESYSCFRLRGGMSLDGMTFSSVCGGVFDPVENAENPDLYPPNERIDEDDRVQMISLGSDEPIALLIQWYAERFPWHPPEEAVIDGLYALPSDTNEVFCDDLLAME